MNDAKTRVEIELKELTKRLNRLNIFYKTDNFKELKAVQQLNGVKMINSRLESLVVRLDMLDKIKQKIVRK